MMAPQTSKFFFLASVLLGVLPAAADLIDDQEEAEYRQERQKQLFDLKQSLFEEQLLGLLNLQMPMPMDDSLPARGNTLHVSRTLQAESARTATTIESRVEVFLPRNRCETGFVKWGDRQNGYRKCRILGRGETLFGTLEDLIKAKRVKPSSYKEWIVAELPRAIPRDEVQSDEQLSNTSSFEHCMYKPEFRTNGASVTTRLQSSIGTYNMATGRKVHPGKPSWGTKKGRYLLPVRMLKIADSRNSRYAGEGDLIKRDAFFFHAHPDEKVDFALESLSTWGCLRMSHSCMEDYQAWVDQNYLLGVVPGMIVVQDDGRVDDYSRE
jgi:hypothetical protein